MKEEMSLALVSSLVELGYSEIEPCRVNRYRKNRQYYIAKVNSIEKVFIKYIVKNDATDLDGIWIERIVYNILFRKEYIIPSKYKKTCSILPYIENCGSIKDIIKTFPEEKSILYIRNIFSGYVNLLDKLNKNDIKCSYLDYTSLMGLYIERWTMYSKKHIMIKKIAIQIFKKVIEIWEKDIDVYTVRYFRIHGDLNPSNCLCCKDYDVYFLDYENICISDPNIDVASMYVKLLHHARFSKVLQGEIKMAVNCFKESRYYCKETFELALRGFSFIQKHWS